MSRPPPSPPPPPVRFPGPADPGPGLHGGVFRNAGLAWAVAVVLALLHLADAIGRRVDPHAHVPPAFQCVVRTAYGCVLYADPERARRYLNAEAGS